jgi:type IV pilus assembly protein PilP
MGDLHAFVQQTKVKHHGKVDPLPEFPPYENFVYAPDQLRDPFKPQTDQMVAANYDTQYRGPRPEQGRRKEPLESFPLDSLKMVGLLQQSDQTWGLVKDPNGTIHRIQPGNYAGQNNGKINIVGESSIDILELVPDGLSGWVNRNAKLAMREES